MTTVDQDRGHQNTLRMGECLHDEVDIRRDQDSRGSTHVFSSFSEAAGLLLVIPEETTSEIHQRSGVVLSTLMHN
jgi:hypothetical protein